MWFSRSQGPPSKAYTPPVSRGSRGSFSGDLRTAAAVWRRFPWLPAVSVGLAALTHLPDEFAPLVLIFLLFNAGWLGTERITYLRAFREESIGAGELWKLTRAFVVRFSVLGLVVAIPFAPFVILGFSHVLSEGPRRAIRVALYVMSVIIDLALTFVTPALAFSTRKVRTALKIGLRLIRSEWPSCAWYVLAPPLAAGFVSQSLARTAGIATQLLTSGLATLLNLWFKGAIAAFYLRQHEDVGRNGAGFAPKGPAEFSNVPE